MHRSCAFAFVATLACAGKPAATTAPSNATASGTAPATPTVVELAGLGWELTAAGASAAAVDEYEWKVTGPGWALSVQLWPASDAFVRSLDQQLEADRGTGTPYTILHQHDGGVGAYELVTTGTAGIDGTVLVDGGGDGAMCGFKLPAGADWQTPLAACQSLRETLDGADGYRDAEGADHHDADATP